MKNTFGFFFYLFCGDFFVSSLVLLLGFGLFWCGLVVWVCCCQQLCGGGCWCGAFVWLVGFVFSEGGCWMDLIQLFQCLPSKKSKLGILENQTCLVSTTKCSGKAAKSSNRRTVQICFWQKAYLANICDSHASLKMRVRFRFGCLQSSVLQLQRLQGM